MSAVAAEPAGVPRARMMLQRAHWAATAFAGYDRERFHDLMVETGERVRLSREPDGEGF